MKGYFFQTRDHSIVLLTEENDVAKEEESK